MMRGSFPSTPGRLVRFALAALLILPSLASAVSARTLFVHEAWTVRDGMPVNSVSSLVQSRTGHVWLGTFDGLVRFDGARFSTYNVGNTPGMVHNRITSVDEMADGRLLLGTDAGVLQLLDPARERAEVIWTTPVNRPNLVWTGPDGTLYTSLRPGLARVIDGRIDAVDLNPLPGLNVTAMAAGRDATIWLATEGAGLWRLSDGRMQQMAAAEAIELEEIFDLLEDDEGRLWVAGRGGVQRLDASGVAWLHVGQQEWRVTTHVLERDGAGGLLLGAETGVFQWRAGHLIPVDPDDPRRAPRILALQRDENAWHISASAAFPTQIESDKTPFEARFRLADLEASRIVNAMVDDHGSLWLATTGAGLHRLRPVAISGLSVAEGLSAREVYPLHQDPSGAIWVGTQKGGLNRVLGGEVVAYGADQGLLDDNIIAIASDADGVLWVATHEAGLFRRSGAEFLSEPDPLLAGAQIRALHLDIRGHLWAGAQTGLYLRDPKLGWQRHAASAELAGCGVRVIRDDGHALWVGTDRCGAFRIAPEESTVEPIPVGAGAGSLYVRDIHLIDADNLWLASEDRGLIRVYREDESLRAVPILARDGLPGGGAHQILDDGHGWLWVSTNQGIYRTRQDRLEAAAAAIRDGQRPPPLIIDRFGEADGMRSREANGGVHNSAIRTAAGELWFATQDGVAIIDPTPARLLRQPRPVIESISSGEQRWAADRVLTLDAAQRSFQVEFSEVGQMVPAQTRLRYRLFGLQEDWVEAGDLRRAHYSLVPPGQYKFRVEGWTGEGWSPSGASQQLTVLPYFHETASFRVLMLCLVAIGLWLAYRARVGWLQAQRRALQRQVELRTEELARGKAAAERASELIAAQAEQLRENDRQKSRFFDDLAHELRTPLTLIIGPLEDVRPVAGDDVQPAIDSALRNGGVLLDLTNQLLDLARLEAGMLRLERRSEDLVALLRTSVERFRPLAARHGIGFRWRLPVLPLAANLDLRHTGKIFDNLLSNAFKFTPAGGEVELVLQVDVDGMARIEVSDTGAGIAPEHLAHVFDRFYQSDASGSRLQPGTGIGLALVHDLTELHGGRLEVRSTPGSGTVFSVLLPLVEAVTPALIPIEAAQAPLPVAALVDHQPWVDEATDPDRTTVLVVDDHAEIRAHVRRQLQPQYRVIEAADGREALALARERLPDLIVADISMPLLDGYELCAQVRSDPELEGLPIILLTARAGIDDRLEGLRAAADDYLTKPFHAEELRTRVDNLIALRRRLRDRYTQQAATAEPPPVAEPAQVAAVAADVGQDMDAAYRNQLLTIIRARMVDETFKVADLADAMGQDRSHLFRRTREVTGQAPSDLIRHLRLERAAELLHDQVGPVGEIAYAVGFSSVAYFTKCFRERFGCTPSQSRGVRVSPIAA